MTSLIGMTFATVSANNGWERKVIKIPAAKIGKNTSIILYFGADSAAKEERYVYFDDINVEPVLQTGVNKFTAKECRLFPSQDAASCTSKNSQVVSDGLVGYCLQHDPANKNVCLLWYPIDEISPDSKSSRSNFGYQGAYPLNYCTEANGNFVLVKKRITTLIDEGTSDNRKQWADKNRCTPLYDNCDNNPNYYTLIEDEVGESSAWRNAWCVPKKEKLLVYDSHKLGGNRACKDWVVYDGWSVYDGFEYIAVGNVVDCDNQNGCYSNCENNTCSPVDEKMNADPNARIYEYDYPAAGEDQLKLISSSETDKVFYPTCNRFVQLVDASGNNKAWASRTSKNSFYPYNTPQYFRDEQNYYGPSCYLKNQGECLDYNDCSTPHCYCNEDGGYCDGDTVFGDCNKWADKPVSCDTPGALQYTANAYNFTMYGRNRSLIPFGAATFPDNFNIFASEPIKFRNQYSNKIDQEAFAGRPYGCTGVGCANLGYCSLDPNVLCVLDSTKGATSSLINKKSCGSANGTCLPLWNAEKLASDLNFVSGNILKNIFLKSFGSFSFSTSTQTYVSGDNKLTTNFKNTYLEDLKSKQACASTNHLSPANDGDYNKYWCPVYPTITNVKLNNITSASLNFNVSTPGVYTLTFNTFVDPEQQPLKDLVINWGDGTVQNLVNQDHRPDAGNPHKVYHFYKGDITTAKIGITITDNWGLYKETGTNTVINPGGEIIK